MAGRLDGRVAVVTGGANGIGRACCVRFAEEGADIVVADILDTAETIALVKEVGREALSCHLDATSRADNEAMAQSAKERFGRIDVLVTAAGVLHADYVSGDLERDRRMIEEAVSTIGQPGAGITALDPAQWQKILDINLTGTMLAVKAVVPTMIDQKSGSIVTIASIAAKRPEAGPIAYSVSKAGVWMLTKQLAGSGRLGRPRERDRARLHRDEHDEGGARSRRGEADVADAGSDGPGRPTGRDREHGALPGLGRILLLHRGDPAPGRRLLHGVSSRTGPADWARLSRRCESSRSIPASCRQSWPASSARNASPSKRTCASSRGSG